MPRALFYILLGYLSGGVLYARLWGRVLHRDICSASRDGNPGTANAFLQGGFLCGGLTLLGDLGKGFVPVFLFFSGGRAGDVPMPLGICLSALVLPAPVLGHIFPVFGRFRGGKGIAVTFGVLLGLLPDWRAVLCLAGPFLFFSLVLKISPHFYRTLAAYGCALVLMPLAGCGIGVCAGFFLIALAVCLRLHFSPEKREKARVSLLWKH